jgi:hypothetical protein
MGGSEHCMAHTCAHLSFIMLGKQRQTDTEIHRHGRTQRQTQRYLDTDRHRQAHHVGGSEEGSDFVLCEEHGFFVFIL